VRREKSPASCSGALASRSAPWGHLEILCGEQLPLPVSFPAWIFLLQTRGEKKQITRAGETAARDAGACVVTITPGPVPLRVSDGSAGRWCLHARRVGSQRANLPWATNRPLSDDFRARLPAAGVCLGRVRAPQPGIGASVRRN